MNYKVEFTTRAIKDLRSLPRVYQSKIIDKSEALSKDPYPQGCIKLKGVKEEFWRIRVGDYRILYQVDDSVKIVDIRRIGHRKGIY